MRIIGLLVCLLIFSKADAQYVTIPDPEFVTWLQDNFDVCMSGNQLDTTCVSGFTYLEIFGTNITNLDGIQYFSNLEELYCQGNQITNIPSLPPNLLDFSCAGNQLTSLPPLPESLMFLDCYDNQLLTLPPLPPTLSDLLCQNNQLTTLPPIPASLNFLICSFNQLTEIPTLPASMGVLLVDNNPNLTCLPPFQSMSSNDPTAFSIANTSIECLPNAITHPLVATLPAIDTMPICDLFNSNGCPVGMSILGKLYADNNSDCVSNTTDDQLANVKVVLSQSGAPMQGVLSQATGTYSFFAALGSYDVSIDTADLPFNVLCPSNNLQSTILSVTDSINYNLDFGFGCKPGYDVTVQSIVRTSGIFFPGQTATVMINAGDLAQYFGTSCNTDGLFGEITATVTGPIGIISVSAPGGVSGNAITWPVMNMSQWNYSVILGLDTAAQAGDQVCFDVTITANTGTDNNPSNNTLTQCFNVVNSYDPNFKEVYPTTPQPNSWYTYTVHFQNTGTAAAQHILIKDTLDANLDWTSFQRLGASHNDLTQVFQNGIVHFNFPNINLPDSNSNEPESHGWIQYRVKSKSTVDPLATTIHNTASIYFDFNDPIVTNDAIIEPSTGIANITSFDFNLFPNPANDNVTISLPRTFENALVEVNDLCGRHVAQYKLSNDRLIIPLDAFANGAYYVQLVSEEKIVGVKKLVVMR